MEIQIEQPPSLPYLQLRMATSKDGRAPAFLTVQVFGKLAHVLISGAHPCIPSAAEAPLYGEIVCWAGKIGDINALIPQFHRALDNYRQKWASSYPNPTDDAEFQNRLDQFDSSRDWTAQPGDPEVKKAATGNGALDSTEMRELATLGRRLYSLVFRQRDFPKAWIEELPAGSRVMILWPNEPGIEHPSIPWPMLYAGEEPGDDNPVEPHQFLGLRFRIEFRRTMTDLPMALGDPEKVYRGHLFFWKGFGKDAYTEAKAQLDCWRSNPCFYAVPSDLPPQEADGEIKKLARELLESAKPSPMSLIYIYCQCDLEAGAPKLIFGDPWDPNDSRDITIATYELPDPQSSYPKENPPLIFFNACSTAAPGGVGLANLLESNFLSRGCRAYLGTIDRVPTRAASRFAQAFFHFFLPSNGRQPLSAGESVSQARRFLWSEYGDLSGLYYHYVSDHDIYMLDKIDPAKLRIVKSPQPAD